MLTNKQSKLKARCHVSPTPGISQCLECGGDVVVVVGKTFVFFVFFFIKCIQICAQLVEDVGNSFEVAGRVKTMASSRSRRISPNGT